MNNIGLKSIDAVTGAFGYTGKYITRELLAQDRKVITFTGHPNRPNPFDEPLPALPYHFDDPEKMTENLEGVETFYNTYWVRFEYGRHTYAKAVDNTRTLFHSAENANVRRFVHVSIANPKQGSKLPYYQGKTILEKALQESTLSHAIIRPTVIFGREDILINNIAYLLRRFPLFAIPGSGHYRIQPIFVEDMADICVQAGRGKQNQVLDAAGPETFAFKDLVSLIKAAVGSKAIIIHLPASIVLWLGRIIGWTLGDVLLTKKEIKGLMMDLLVSSQPPRGKTKFTDWVYQNSDSLGTKYASEVKRHYKNSN